MRYSEGFRNSVLRKVLPPESRSFYVMAKEMGVSPMTIQNWLTKVKDGKIVIGSESADNEPLSVPRRCLWDAGLARLTTGFLTARSRFHSGGASWGRRG